MQASGNTAGAVMKSPLALPSASLTFRDLAFSLPLPNGESKTILEPCSGHFEPGQLVALMGPSGCGKSTLLDMLAMKKTSKYSGEVLVNGHPRDSRLFRRIAAYVGQEDVMPAHWKVREAIKFNAALKTQGRAAEGAVIDLLLEAFGLAGVADTYIGGPQVRGISGGQRRRVTLARGVAAQASILFCDEPTSGLSATDAELCVKALRLIAKRLGTLILVVIHQPRIEVTELFDTLVVLTSNPGRMAYLGPIGRAAAYMQECGHPVPEYVNPTDYLLDLLTPGTKLDASEHFVAAFQDKMRPAVGEQVWQAFQKKGQTAQQMLQTASGAEPGRFAVPFSRQFSRLLRRKLAITLRNPMGIGLPLLLPVMMGAVVGIMFMGIGSQGIQQQVSFIFIAITILSLGGMQIMPAMIDQRTFMKYETSEALYAEGAAALVSLCVDVPLGFMGSAYQILIMYSIAGMDAEYLTEVFFWCMLLFFVYDALFGFIAAVAEDAQQAQALATPLISIFLLFNGFVVTKASAPSWLRWIFSVSPNGYAMQAIVVKIAKGFGPTGQFVIDFAGFVEDQNAQGIAVLVCMIVLLRAMQLVAMRLCHNVQK